MKAKLKEQYKEVMEDAKIAEKIEFPKDLEVNKDGEYKVGEKLLSFCKNLGVMRDHE
jgi:hypothetical protein